MAVQGDIKKKYETFSNILKILAILLVLSLFQSAQAQQWERVSGSDGPGVCITDESPSCWFSISNNGPLYFIAGSSYIQLNDIHYNGLNQVLEFYAYGGNGYPYETHVYDGTYNSLGQATGFKELRHYPISANTYHIEISDVSYNGFGQVMNGFPVNITKNSDIEIPPPASGGNPSGSWSGSMGMGGTISSCINSSDGNSELCWSMPYSYYGFITTASGCANGTYTYTSPNNYQAEYSGTAIENQEGLSSNYTLTINGWLDSYDSASGYYVINFDTPGWPSSYSGLWFMQRIDLTEKASSPYPANEVTEQSTNLILCWSGGGSETSFDVYFGTDPNLNESEFMGNQSGMTYDPGILLYGTTYYWRIDARNAQGTTTGDIWSFTTTQITGTEDISDYISGIYIEHIWDYGDPTDSSDLMYEFYLEIYAYDDTSINMDADVSSIEVLTPAGHTFQIPKQPGQWLDSIWTSYEYSSEDWWVLTRWEYRARFEDIVDLQNYGDGEYTIILHYNNSGQSQTKVWFGNPDTNEPTPQPTQEPVLIFPSHHQTIESPVTFNWEPCTDQNTTYIDIDADELGTAGLGDKLGGFNVSETGWGPVYMPDGIWEVEVTFQQWIPYFMNNDGIMIDIGSHSKSKYKLILEGSPWTMYEVWGGDTWIDWRDGSYGNIADLEANGYVKLGESDGQTATFSGQYEYYLIATIGEFLLDSIQGSDGSYYSSFESYNERNNIYDEDNMLGSPDGRCAIVGENNPWDDYSGYFVFTNPGDWEGLTVITSDLNLNLSKSIVNTDEIEIIGPYDIITYRICFDSNNLIQDVTDVTVVDILPDEVSFISADSNEFPGEYNPETHTCAWYYPALSPESVITHDLTVKVNQDVAIGTTVTNFVTINSNETPPTTANISLVTSKASPIMGELQIVPDTIRRNGTLTGIIAVLTLPEGIEENVDANELLVLFPVDQDEIKIPANDSPVVTETDGRTVIISVFDKTRLMEVIPGYGLVKLKFEGKFISGRTFYGETTITITRFAGN